MDPATDLISLGWIYPYDSHILSKTLGIFWPQLQEPLDRQKHLTSPDYPKHIVFFAATNVAVLGASGTSMRNFIHIRSSLVWMKQNTHGDRLWQIVHDIWHTICIIAQHFFVADRFSYVLNFTEASTNHLKVTSMMQTNLPHQRYLFWLNNVKPKYPYISIHIHTYPYISIHIHTYPYISIHIHTYPYISIHIHTYPYISIHIHTYPYISIHIHTSPYISIHIHTSAYICIHLHTSPYISIHLHTSPYISIHLHTSPYISIHLHTSPYISIHLHTSPYISIHLHTSPYISIHLHTSPYISIHLHTSPYISRHIQTYPDISRHIQTYPDISRHIQTYPDISRHIQTYPDISRHIHTYPYISIHIHTYPYISIHIHTYPYIFTHLPVLYGFIPTFSNPKFASQGSQISADLSSIGPVWRVPHGSPGPTPSGSAPGSTAAAAAVRAGRSSPWRPGPPHGSGHGCSPQIKKLPRSTPGRQF